MYSSEAILMCKEQKIKSITSDNQELRNYRYNLSDN